MTVATLAAGLRDSARVRVDKDSVLAIPERFLLALAVDNLTFLSWTKTKDAEKGINRPNFLTEKEKAKENRNDGFVSASDFEAKRMLLLDQLRKKKGG